MMEFSHYTYNRILQNLMTMLLKCLQYQHQQHQIPKLRIVVIIIILVSTKLRQSFKPICLSKRKKYTTKPTQLKTVCLESSKTHLPKKKNRSQVYLERVRIYEAERNEKYLLRSNFTISSPQVSQPLFL